MSAVIEERVTPGADESALVLAGLLERCEPFVYARIGDGDLYCAFELSPYGTGQAKNTNGELSSPGLAPALRDAVVRIAGLPGHVYWGDYLSRTPGAVGLMRQWDEASSWLAGRPMLSVEALLFHRASAALRHFYKTAAADRRRKVYVGPAALTQAAELLQADFLEVPASNAYELADEIAARVKDWSVVYVSAGYASKLIIANAWQPGQTYVELGSALDPVYRSEETRTGQLAQTEARALLEGLL